MPIFLTETMSMTLKLFFKSLECLNEHFIGVPQCTSTEKFLKSHWEAPAMEPCFYAVFMSSCVPRSAANFLPYRIEKESLVVYFGLQSEFLDTFHFARRKSLTYHCIKNEVFH